VEQIGSGTTILTSTSNSYTGLTEIDGGILNVASLANGGSNSSIGASSNAASNLVFGGGTLQYSGTTAQTTDRLFTIGDANGNTANLNASGTGAGTVSFTNTGAIVYGTTGVAHGLTLSGANTGNNLFAPLLTNDASGDPTSLTKSGTGTWDVTNSNNSYTGATTIDGGILNAASLANGGSNSSIGASSNAASNLVFNGGTLQYSGATAQTTDRLFTIGDASNTVTTNPATLDASGTGAATVSFTNTGSIAFANPVAHNLTLTGSNTGLNTFAPVLADGASGDPTSLNKSGSGTWVITGDNTYTGGTTVAGGTLYANNSTSATGTGAVTVSGSGTLAGLGRIAPTGSNGVSVTGGGSLAPGGVQPASVHAGTPGAVANGNLTLFTPNTGSPSTSFTSGSTLLNLNSASLTFAEGTGATTNATGEIITGSQIVVTGPGGTAVANTIAFNNSATNVVTIDDLIGPRLVLNGEYVLIAGNDTTYTGLTLATNQTYSPTGYDYGYRILGGLSLLPSGTPGNVYNQWYSYSMLFLKGDNIDFEVAPEPGTWALLLASLVLLVFHHRRRTRKLF
jgi:fibronectin-binding autotransporter adhesin